MLENGYTENRRGESVNDTIRRLNNEGWRVMQVIRMSNTSAGFLLERVLDVPAAT